MSFLTILGIFDMAAGIVLFIAASGRLSGSLWLVLISAVLIIKAFISIVSSFSSGYFRNWLGVIDIASFIMLLAAFFGTAYGFYAYMALLLFLKGLYTAVMGIVR